MSVKPIFIIGLPSGVDHSELLNAAEDISQDYHVFVYTDESNEFKFQVFSDHEIEPIELENLKEIIS